MKATRIHHSISILQFLSALAAACLLAVLPMTVKAQDFYGEGKVKIFMRLGIT